MAESESLMEPLLTTEEIAEYLRVEVVTVRRLVTRGELPAYRIGGEFRFIAPDVENFVRNQRVSAENLRGEFDKFTERTRKVLNFANMEAAELDHNFIGTEHLLLGVMREGEGVAAMALRRSDLNFKDLRQRVMDIIEKGSQKAAERPAAQIKAAVQSALNLGRSPNPFGERGLTLRAKKVIELAATEARLMGHRYIGTEHLLLGMLREGDGLAAHVLSEAGALKLEPMRELVLQILQENTTLSVPEIPEQAATLLTENEQGMECNRCGARSPDYFRFCFHCGLKFS